MARRLFDTGIFSIITDASAIGIGWTLAFYQAETNVPIVTYNAPSGGSANSNPVEADGDGRFGEIWIEESQSIKYVLATDLGVIKVTVDDFPIEAAAPTIDADLDDFLVGTDPLPIANGGSGQATASNAIAALGGLPVAGGTMTDDIIRSGKGVYLFNANSGQVNGAVYVTVDSDPDPTSAAGEWWAVYS